MSENDMQLIVPGDNRVPLQVFFVLSASAGAVRFLWKALRRGPSAETEEPGGANGAVRKLWRLYAETWDEMCRYDPVSATMNGDDRNNGRLCDLSEDARRNHLKKLQDLERRVNTINFADLQSEKERNNYLCLKETLRLEIRAKETFEVFQFPTHHLFGPHLLLSQLPAIQNIRNRGDARNFISRLRAFESQANQIIDGFKAGIKSKMTLHLHAVQTMIQQCQLQVVESPMDSSIYQMMMGRVRAVGGNVDHLKAAIEDSVIPAYRKLTEFLRNEYVWEARKEPGIWCLPSGDRIYRGCLEYFTSLDASPEDLHDIGLAEVERITEKIYKVRRLLGEDKAKSNLEYVEHMKENPDNFFESADAVLDRYQAILGKADEKLPYFFDSTPNAPLLVKAIDEQQAEFAPPAHYHPSSQRDGKSPAIFYANTANPESRPRYQMEAIALHEGVPGHHIQLGLAQELEGLPRLRRAESPCSLSFVQGWALYAEYLGEVMNFYEDPRCYLGRLLTEIWRATRLVVDTGIHAKKWSRDQAVTYMKNNACLGDSDIMFEIDRIVTMPGQAVAYKVGELRLRELRDFAQRRLDSKFSWREFHGAVLSAGTVPLSVVDRNVTEYVTASLRGVSRDAQFKSSGSFQDQLSSSRRGLSRKPGD